MTDQEKQRISEMRAAGLSYQTIADETGFSLGSIKMYFRRSKETVSSSPRCEQCHKPLRQDIVRVRRFCSDACRVRWWSAHPEKMKNHQFRCQYCGRVFCSRKPRKYCSRPCFYASRKGGGRV